MSRVQAPLSAVEPEVLAGRAPWSPLPVADVLSAELWVRVVGDTAVCPIRGPGWQEMLQRVQSPKCLDSW